MTTQLLHMSTVLDWRAAQDTRAVRPPSLAEVGFVHLSTPEQVHLPANRLFSGRTDLVLLVVDPDRLPDEVRWEPGVPTDPASMVFPHLYGPLPTAAVVAVLSYRPGPDGAFAPPAGLPGVQDRAARAAGLTRSVAERRAVAVVPVSGGVAVLDPRHPLSHEHNRLLVSAPADPGTVAAEAEAVLGGAGLRHRQVRTTDPSLAAGLRGRGWSVQELVVMERAPGAGPAVGRAELVAQEQVHPLWRDGWRREGLADDVVTALVDREASTDVVLAVLDVAVLQTGAVVSAAQLRVDGASAALEAVMTDPAHRGRGHADAVLQRALAEAAGRGVDLVVLEAATHDWPRHWYARRGFRELGPVWECTLG